MKKAHGGQATGKIRERSHKNHNIKAGGGQGYMKKCRCKCRRAGGGRAMLAPTAKDQELKRLTAERDMALDVLDTLTKVLNMIVGKETENG